MSSDCSLAGSLSHSLAKNTLRLEYQNEWEDLPFRNLRPHQTPDCVWIDLGVWGKCNRERYIFHSINILVVLLPTPAQSGGVGSTYISGTTAVTY